MKIMIIEDETLVRVGIKTIIPWEENGHRIVAEAGDGLEALDLFRQARPDIVLVDILLPGMSGLEFIAQAKKQHPDCKFVILTCLNELKYAKEAMRLGARDYIIKASIDSQELLRIVGEVSAEIEAERAERATAAPEPSGTARDAAEAVRESLNAGDWQALGARLALADQALAGQSLFVFSLRILRFEALVKTEPRRGGLAARGIRSVCSEIFPRYCAGLLLENGESGYTGLIAPHASAGDAQEAVSALCQNIIRAAKLLLGVDVRIGASCQSATAEHLAGACIEAEAARESLFFTGEQFGFFSAGNSIGTDDATQIGSLTDALFACIVNLNFGAALSALARIRTAVLKSAPRTTPDAARKIYRDIYYWLVTTVKKDMLDIYREHSEFCECYAELQRAESLDELQGCLEGFLRLVNESVTVRSAHRQAALIEKARDYIRDNLAKESLGIEDVSAQTGLSQGYFGKVFKKETGLSFTDYVQAARIEKSKELMHNGEKIWAVAAQVGYPDLSSFSRAFKKATGISPSQYKSTLG